MSRKRPRRAINSQAFAQGYVLRKPPVSRSITVCAHSDGHRYSSAPSILSVAVATTIILAPLFTSHRSKLVPAYKRFAPPAASVVLAASIFVRARRKNSRDVNISQKEAIGDASSDVLIVNTHNTSTKTKPSTKAEIFSAARDEWDEPINISVSGFSAESQKDNTTLSTPDPFNAPESSSPYFISYRDDSSSTRFHKEASKPTPSVGMDTSAVFGHMREEFDSQENITDPASSFKQSQEFNSRFTDFERAKEIRDEETQPASRENESIQKRKRQQTFKVEHPSSISAPDVMRWIIRIPSFVLCDIIVPVSEVSSVIWYDCKQWLAEKYCNEKHSFFLEDAEYSTGSDRIANEQEEPVWHSGTPEEKLSEEEKQIQEVQRIAQTTMRGIGRTVSRLMGKML